MLAALHREVELTAGYLQNTPVETIYFGGGTPSLLNTNEIISLLDKLSAHYNMDGLKEFTLEANPDDLTDEKVKELEQLKKYGLNRFSIGVQSFFDEDLIYMNRAHNSGEALAAIKRVQQAGFNKITIDLIYGTPTMNDERWHQNLQTAFSLQVPHISSYALTVEPKTTLQRHIADGKKLKVNEEQSARQFQILVAEMNKAGYEQYEISNFALPGWYAIHNTNYWRGKHYLGLGPSAHSFNGHSRRWNVANNNIYAEKITGGILPYEEEILTPAQQVNEKIMTALRTQWGLNLQQLPTPYAAVVINNIKNLQPAHYTLNNNVLTLTNQGKLFADGIAAELFVEDL